MHPNEIKVTESNIEYLRKIAKEMSPAHLEAIEEQIRRQDA
jgi:hypothetical protein